MISGIVAFLQALPAILELMSRLGNVMDRILKIAEQNSLNQWIDHLEKAVDQIESAKSAAEKLDAAQTMVRLIRDIGPK